MSKKFQLPTSIVKLKTLSMQQKTWFLIAIYKLLHVSFLLRIFGFKWLKSKIETGVKGELHSQSIETAKNMHESIRLAARCLPFKLECLPKSLVLVDMLQQRDIPAELKLGITSSEKSLQGHAWVSVSGNKIAEPDDMDEKFVELTLANYKRNKAANPRTEK